MGSVFGVYIPIKGGLTPWIGRPARGGSKAAQPVEIEVQPEDMLQEWISIQEIILLNWQRKLN